MEFYCAKCNKITYHKKTYHKCHTCQTIIEGTKPEKIHIVKPERVIKPKIVIVKKHNKNKLLPRHILIPEWSNIRIAILERDKVCQMCGSSVILQVHHIDRNIYNNDHSNLILLCSMCHIMKVHHK